LTVIARREATKQIQFVQVVSGWLRFARHDDMIDQIGILMMSS
jgi:hypothetical protein